MICKLHTTSQRHSLKWPFVGPNSEDIFNELIQTAARIPKIDKIIELWEDSQDIDDGHLFSLVALEHYIDYMTHYPIPAEHLYLDFDASTGEIVATAYFDTYRLIMKFSMMKTTAEYSWKDHKGQNGH